MYISSGTSSLLRKASSSSSTRRTSAKYFYSCSSSPSTLPRSADSCVNQKVATSFNSQCQNYSSSSFSSALRSVRCSVPRWSHGVDWKSPASLSAQIRTASPVFNGFYRKMATLGKFHPFIDY